MEIKEDDFGIYVKIELFKDTNIPEAAKAYSLLKYGEIDSFSIGYRVTDSDYIELESGKSVCIIKELVLYEVSLVTFPMNEKAEVTVVKEERISMEKEIKDYVENLKASEEAQEVATQVVEEIAEKEAETSATEPVVEEAIEVKEEPVEEVKAELPLEEKKKKPCKKATCPDCGCEFEIEPEEEPGMEDCSKAEEAPLEVKATEVIDIKALKQDILNETKNMLENFRSEFEALKQNTEKVEEKELTLEDFVNKLLNTDIIL